MKTNKEPSQNTFRNILWDISLFMGCPSALLTVIGWAIFLSFLGKDEGIPIIVPAATTVITALCITYQWFDRKRCPYCNGTLGFEDTEEDFYEYGQHVGEMIIDVYYQYKRKCKSCGREWRFGRLEREHHRRYS